MAKVTPITEQFQHFVSELKESFWGDLQGQVQQAMRRRFELLSERQRGYGVRATAPGNCWSFCAVRGRARVPGKGCWRICTAVG